MMSCWPCEHGLTENRRGGVCEAERVCFDRSMAAVVDYITFGNFVATESCE